MPAATASPVVLNPADLRAVNPQRRILARAGATGTSHPVACKCEICTCGTHQCDTIAAYKPTANDPANMTTSNRADYHPHSLAAAKSESRAPRRDYVPSTAEFSDATTNKADFAGKSGKPSTPFRPARNGIDDSINATAERDFSTESTRQFASKGFQRRAPMRPEVRALTAAPFNGETTHHSDYCQWNGAKPSTPIRAVGELKTNDGNDTRDFRSESAVQYHAHQIVKTPAFVPPQRTLHNAPFSGQSTYSAEHHEWKDVRPAQPFRPAHNDFASANAGAVQDFATENSRQYGAKRAEMAVSAAPKRSYEKSAAKFDGESTHKHDFSGANGKPATPFRPTGNSVDVIALSSSSNDYSTESRREFDKKDFAKRAAMRPEARALASTVPFDDRTSNKSDYQRRQGKPSTPIKVAGELKLAGGTDDRDFRSESAVQYHQHPMVKTAPFVPPQRSVNSGKFEGESHYNESHRAFVFAPCPAAQLVKSDRTGDDGHSIYHKEQDGSWR